MNITDQTSFSCGPRVRNLHWKHPGKRVNQCTSYWLVTNTSNNKAMWSHPKHGGGRGGVFVVAVTHASCIYTLAMVLVWQTSTSLRKSNPSVKETSFTCSLVISTKKAACSFRMFERSCLRQCRLFMFIRHYASCEVSCGMLTKVCKARMNYLKLLCFLHYPLTVWSHISTGCSQGGKVTFRIRYVPLSQDVKMPRCKTKIWSGSKSQLNCNIES